MFGRGYVIEHCAQELKRRAQEMSYRNYVTDALMLIAESTANAAGGRYLTERYAELIGRKAPTETPEEVVERFSRLFAGREGQDESI